MHKEEKNKSAADRAQESIYSLYVVPMCIPFPPAFVIQTFL